MPPGTASHVPQAPVGPFSPQIPLPVLFSRKENSYADLWRFKGVQCCNDFKILWDRQGVLTFTVLTYCLNRKRTREDKVFSTKIFNGLNFHINKLNFEMYSGLWGVSHLSQVTPLNCSQILGRVADQNCIPFTDSGLDAFGMVIMDHSTFRDFTLCVCCDN